MAERDENLGEGDLADVTGGGSYQAWFDDSPRPCAQCGRMFTPASPGMADCARCYSHASF